MEEIPNILLSLITGLGVTGMVRVKWIYHASIHRTIPGQRFLCSFTKIHLSAPGTEEIHNILLSLITGPEVAGMARVK